MNRFKVGDRIIGDNWNAVTEPDLIWVVHEASPDGFYTVSRESGELRTENTTMYGYKLVEEKEIDYSTQAELYKALEPEKRYRGGQGIGPSSAETSSTGALRYNSDKPQLSQIDPLFLIGLAELMTQSAKKYSKWNYAKGQNLTTVCDSMSRHLLSFLNGENDDKESGKSHLLHIAANCLIAYSTTERHLEKHPELDDRISAFFDALDQLEELK